MPASYVTAEYNRGLFGIFPTLTLVAGQAGNGKSWAITDRLAASGVSVKKTVSLCIHEDPLYTREKLSKAAAAGGAVGVHVNVMAIGETAPGVQVMTESRAFGEWVSNIDYHTRSVAVGATTLRVCETDCSTNR